MENPTSSLKSHLLQYGILLGGISVIFNLMLFFLDMHYTQEPAAQWVNWFITISVTVLGIYNFKSTNGGYLSLGEALKLGLGIGVIAAFIAIAYTFVLLNYLDPDTIEKTMDITQNKLMDENPEISQDQLDQIIEMQKKFSGIGVISTVILVMSLVFGFIISLITGLILKRNRPE